MLVKFARMAYLDRLYEDPSIAHDVPESFRDSLPPGAKIFSEAPAPQSPVVQVPVALSSLHKKPIKKSETFGDLAREDDLNL